MKRLLILLAVMLFYISANCQKTAKTDEFRNELDSTIDVRALPLDLSTVGLLSSGPGLLKKVEVISADNLYPTIIIQSNDTTGYKPEKPGDMFIDRSARKVYVAVDTNRGDYIIVTEDAP